MSRKDHGYNLQEPMLQPKTSNFRQTSSGFDTGEREFIVDARYYDLVRPQRHTPDNKLRWRDATGAIISGTYARMFVDEVSAGDERNGLLRYTVRFLGMLGASKPGDVTEDTEIGQFRTRSNRSIGVESGAVSFTAYEYVPTVTHVYVSLTKPNRFEVGSKKTPPNALGETKAHSRAVLPYISGLRDVTVDILFQGWVLRSRSVRQIGTVWEVHDVYAYETVRRES